LQLVDSLSTDEEVEGNSYSIEDSYRCKSDQTMHDTSSRIGSSPATAALIARKPVSRFKAIVAPMLISTFLTLLAGEVIARVFVAADPVEVHPELLWRNRPSVKYWPNPAVSQGSRWITVDERGFRKTVGVPSAGGRRLVVLGDSAMFGFLLDDGETFSSQLQSLAGSKLHVINTGVVGWGLFQEEILLRREIKELRPEIVLVHHQSFDVLRQPLDEPQRSNYFFWHSRLKEAVKFSRLATVFARLVKKVRLALSHKSVDTEVADLDSGPIAPLTASFVDCWKKDAERLLAIKELVERHGAKLVVLTGSPRDQLQVERDGPRIRFFVEQMAALCRANGILEVSMTERMRGLDEKLMTLLPVDRHPSAFWNRLNAEETYRRLDRAGLLGDSRDQ
jgi:hypothetical protein